MEIRGGFIWLAFNVSFLIKYKGEKMINRFKFFAICLVAFASMQSAQAGLVYSSGSVVPSNPGSFQVSGMFSVEAGEEYKASISDVFDSFDVYSMTVVDQNFDLVDSAFSNSGAGDGDSYLSFVFTAISDAVYSVFLGGENSSHSLYLAKIESLPSTGANPVPVPGAIWFMGSAIFALVGLGRRKVA